MAVHPHFLPRAGRINFWRLSICLQWLQLATRANGPEKNLKCSGLRISSSIGGAAPQSTKLLYAASGGSQLGFCHWRMFFRVTRFATAPATARLPLGTRRVYRPDRSRPSLLQVDGGWHEPRAVHTKRAMFARMSKVHPGRDAERLDLAIHESREDVRLNRIFLVRAYPKFAVERAAVFARLSFVPFLPAIDADASARPRAGPNPMAVGGTFKFLFETEHRPKDRTTVHRTSLSSRR
jgi:hypothetical protein